MLKYVLLFFVVLISGCAQVQIKDWTFYGDKGLLGAVEVHTQKDTVVDIPKGQWDNLRFGMLCTSTDTFAEIKAEVEKLCSYYPNCTYEISPTQAKQFIFHLNKLIHQADKARMTGFAP